MGAVTKWRRRKRSEKRRRKGKEKEKKEKKKKKREGVMGEELMREREGGCLPRGGEWVELVGKGRKRKERKERKIDKNNNITIRLKNRLPPKNPQKYPKVENVILRNNMKSVFQNKIPFSN